MDSIDSQNVITKTPNQFPMVVLTRQGVMYLAVNLILIVTATNYSNHNILVVALFLLSILAVSLVTAVRVFRGAEIRLGEIRPVFLNQQVHIPVHIKFKHSIDEIPLEIKLELDNGESIAHSLKLTGDQSVPEQVRLSPGKRGRYKLINVQIASSFPFGLFRIRRSFAAAQTFWVYVTPLDATTATSGMKKSRRGKERGDSVFLRQYRLGDPVRRIHKKSLAMGQNILVKDVEAQAPESQWLQWNKLNLPTEKRLQVLTRQVLDAEQQGKAYGLWMPNGKISPGVGEAHKHQCLRLLAEF